MSDPPKRILSVGIGPPPKPRDAARIELVLAAAQLGAAQLQVDVAIAHQGLAMASAGGTRLDIKQDQTFTPLDVAAEDLCESALEFARANGWTPPPAPEYGSAAAGALQGALDVIARECEAFVMFVRVGHLDPPRPDGKVPVAIVAHRSSDPGIDDALRDTIQRWLSGDVPEEG